MKLFEKMKHYNFWVALSMAFLLLLNTVARAFNIEIDNDLYNDIVMAVLGVVTVLGFVQKDGFAFTNTDANANADKNANTDANADADKTDNTTIGKTELSVMTAKRDNVENSTTAEQLENADADKVADANNTAQPATHTVGKAE